MAMSFKNETNTAKTVSWRYSGKSFSKPVPPGSLLTWDQTLGYNTALDAACVAAGLTRIGVT